MTRVTVDVPDVAPAPARESFPDLCRRAADRLDALHAAATPGPWIHTDGFIETLAPRGLVGRGRMDDAALTVVLRPLASLLAAYLREKAHSADVRERTVPGFVFKDHALTAIARTILGETT